MFYTEVGPQYVSVLVQNVRTKSIISDELSDVSLEGGNHFTVVEGSLGHIYIYICIYRSHYFSAVYFKGNFRRGIAGVLN
jgi:hypothetical protein